MLFFGSADIDLIPPEPLPLGGYTERRSALFESGGDTLTARVRVIGDVVLVSAEMLTIPESLFESVRRKSGVEKLFLVATHTHCAPDSQMLNDRMTFQIPGISPFRRRWLEWYSDQISAGIKVALEGGNAGVTEFSVQRTPVPLARSRRRIGAPDNMATRVSAVIAGSRVNLFTVFGAHPTLFDSQERRLRGDWPGELMRRSGGLAFTGALGNASPVPVLGPASTPEDNVRAFALGLDLAVGAASSSSVAATPPTFTTVPIAFDSAVPHPEFAKANSVTDDLARSVVSQFAPKRATLTSVRIGDLVVLGVPGEPSGVLSREIAAFGKRFGLKTAVVSHVNGWAGYLLDPEDYRRGGYEAQLSFYGETAGIRVLEAARVSIENLSSPKLGTAIRMRRP